VEKRVEGVEVRVDLLFLYDCDNMKNLSRNKQKKDRGGKGGTNFLKVHKKKFVNLFRIIK
jgi:hypothetical protein